MGQTCRFSVFPMGDERCHNVDFGFICRVGSFILFLPTAAVLSCCLSATVSYSLAASAAKISAKTAGLLGILSCISAFAISLS